MAQIVRLGIKLAEKSSLDYENSHDETLAWYGLDWDYRSLG